MLYSLTFEGEVNVIANNEKEAIGYLSNKLDLLEKHSFLDFNKVTIRTFDNDEG